MVLGDERLSDEAAKIVEVAGRLVQDEKATLTGEVVESALSLLRELAERSESDEVRADIDAVIAELAQMIGLTSAEAIETLMRSGPRGGYQRKA
jgi:hypothetical protein